MDLAILEASQAAGATPEAWSKCSTVLDELYRVTGVGPGVAYEPLCDLARPWSVNLALLDFNGNWGTPADLPAGPRYTECRPTPLGEAALLAERGEIGRLPIGLINGNIHVEGRRPPLDPIRVVAVIRAALDESTTEADLVRLVGAPSFPTSCEVAGDLEALASGAETELMLSARIEVEGRRLVLSNLPPRTSAEELEFRVMEMVDDDQDGSIQAVRNETTRTVGTRVVIQVRTAADVAAVVERVLALWPVRKQVPAGFDRPLAHLIRDIADDRRNLDERLSMIEAAAARST